MIGRNRMKLVKLRFRLHKLGLTLEQVGDHWEVDNGGSAKNNVCKEFASIEEVETWVDEMRRNQHESVQDIHDFHQ